MDSINTYIRFDEKPIMRKRIYLIKTNNINIFTTNHIKLLLLYKEVQPIYNSVFFFISKTFLYIFIFLLISLLLYPAYFSGVCMYPYGL